MLQLGHALHCSTLCCARCLPQAGLAQNRYFKDEAFLEYLKYLLYWREPQYARFVV